MITFIGLPHEGGAYPKGGADNMAKLLIPVIEKAGGVVLVNAFVQEILVDDNGTAT
eukprot:Awhi_evm1s8471